MLEALVQSFEGSMATGCQRMIKDSTIVFITLYMSLLLFVTGMYIKYRIELVRMRAGNEQQNNEWKLVHKLMGE